MGVYKFDGQTSNNAYSHIGNLLSYGYDYLGNSISLDYNKYDNDYQKKILDARNEWASEYRNDNNIIPMVIHTDQHSTLNRHNTLFDYLSLAVKWSEASACIGLGDVNEYINNGASHDGMLVCLQNIPKEKQINIWGNHDTWGQTGDGALSNTIDTERLIPYFDNSAYPNNHRYNKYGIEYMIDAEKHVKYVCIGGWEYDPNLGNHQTYNIGYDGMEYIIDMLSSNDSNDIVILSHVQPFAEQSTWNHPPVEDATMPTKFGRVFTLTSIDQMLQDRKNRTSGTVKDSYGNDHAYDFTGCTSDLICCFAGHEHIDGYAIQRGIPVYVFDAYAYDAQPFYFVNVDRAKRRLNIWKVDNTPRIYNYQIPFANTQ